MPYSISFCENWDYVEWEAWKHGMKQQRTTCVPSLEVLTLIGCGKLRNIPLANGFPSLEELYINVRSNLTDICLSNGHSCLKKVA